MAYSPHLITPFVDSGLKKYFKPFIIGETAFTNIFNAYAWRGTVRKREGYTLFNTVPGGLPIQKIDSWINPTTLNFTLFTFNTRKAYYFDGTNYTDTTFNPS